jgi:hypothetical protein
LWAKKFVLTWTDRPSRVAAGWRRGHDGVVHPADRDLVEVFDLAASTPVTDEADELQLGPSRPPLRPLDRWTWWRNADGLNQGMATVAVAALIVAGVMLVKAGRANPEVIRSTKTVVAPAPVIAVDALGCPRGRKCTTATAPASALRAVQAALPGAQVTYSMLESDSSSRQTYRLVIFLRSGQTTMQVVSQCVPGAAAVIDTPLSVGIVFGTTVTPLSADAPTPKGTKTWDITLGSPRPGAAGCGINVRADSTSVVGVGDQAVDTVVNQLADSPDLMVDK